MDSLDLSSGRLSKIREIFVEQLSKGLPVRMNIKGRCMHPFIRRSDIVTVKPIKFEDTKVGDIVVYNRDLKGDFTVHRVIRKRVDRNGKENLLTKGDASQYGDPPVYAEDVYGKVIAIERNGKSINLETKFNCILGYLIAYLSYYLALGQEAVFQFPLFLRRVWHKVKICINYREYRDIK
ncbi:MAG: signal peptidase I [bacterium]|nr:signal peptidase I [bacterium]